MTTKISKSYKLLFEFSERLYALAPLFKMPVKDQQFAKVLPRIYYELDVIRHLEFIIRDKIFSGDEAQKTFCMVDEALYHVQYALYAADRRPSEFPNESYNLAVNKELAAAAQKVVSLQYGQTLINIPRSNNTSFQHTL